LRSHTQQTRGTTLWLIGFLKGKTPRVINNAGTRTREGNQVMNNMLGKTIAASALAGALALVGTAPSYAANGRNAAFAAGVGAGLVGGAVLGGGYAAPAYGGYYGGPGYAYGAYGYHRPYYRHRYYRHWYR
jgi:hypothetical protein